MNREAAARYIGISTTKFDELVKDGRMPKGKRIDGRVVWDRYKLDASFTDLPDNDGNMIDAILAKAGRDNDREHDLPDLSLAPCHPPKQKRSDDIPRELLRYYCEIGFDPRTMGERERGELRKKAEQEWVASVPGRPIGKRETDALEDLSKHGVGVFVDWSGVKGCGPDTMDRLVARGFITTKNMQKYPDRIAGLILTKAGMAAWKKIERER
jgi:predicted DNA-binding transcriptional regulator AlpA